MPLPPSDLVPLPSSPPSHPWVPNFLLLLFRLPDLTPLSPSLPLPASLPFPGLTPPSLPVFLLPLIVFFYSFFFLPFFSEYKVSTLRPGVSFLEIFTLVLLAALCLLVWTLVTRYTHLRFSGKLARLDPRVFPEVS